MCARDCNLNLEELLTRLPASHTVLVEAKAAVDQFGSAAATRQPVRDLCAWKLRRIEHQKNQS